VPVPAAVSPVPVPVDEVVVQVDGVAAATAGAAVVAGAASSEDDAAVSVGALVEVAVGVLSGADSVGAVDGAVSLSAAAAASGSGSAAVSVVGAGSSDEVVESDVASGAGSSDVDVVVASSVEVGPVVSAESWFVLGVSVVAGSSAVAVSDATCSAAGSACVVAGCSSAWAATDVPTAMQAYAPAPRTQATRLRRSHDVRDGDGSGPFPSVVLPPVMGADVMNEAVS
jgi:hypothetical protein